MTAAVDRLDAAGRASIRALGHELALELKRRRSVPGRCSCLVDGRTRRPRPCSKPVAGTCEGLDYCASHLREAEETRDGYVADLALARGESR